MTTQSFNMYKYLLSVFAFFALMSFALLPAGNDEDEYINFSIKNAGVTVSGAFESWKKDVSIKDDDLNNATFNGVIEVKSINTGIGKRDRDLMKKSYFHEDAYPKIAFKSNTIKKSSDNTYRVEGDLVIRNNKKSVTLVLEKETEGGKPYYTTSIELNRRDFDVGGRSLMLSDDLTAKIRVSAD